MYGRKNGFTVHLLRYFLLLNWGRNLHITDNEYLALVAMVMGRSHESYYQGIVLKPTARCVTIGNWFQVLNSWHKICFKNLKACFFEILKD